MNFKNLIAIAQADVQMPFDPIPLEIDFDAPFSIGEAEKRKALINEHSAYQSVMALRKLLDEKGIDWNVSAANNR